MALTAAQIQARIDTLQAARDSGVLSVGHGVDKVVYQSPRDMDRTLAKLKADLAAANGETPRPRVNYLEQTSKGFGCFPDTDAGYGDSDAIEN